MIKIFGFYLTAAYGEKVKAYLRCGARELPGFERWPNNQMGYGALCVRERLRFASARTGSFDRDHKESKK